MQNNIFEIEKLDQNCDNDCENATVKRKGKISNTTSINGEMYFSIIIKFLVFSLKNLFSLYKRMSKVVIFMRENIIPNVCVAQIKAFAQKNIIKLNAFCFF